MFLQPRFNAFSAEVGLTGIARQGVPDHVCHANGAYEVVLYWLTNLTLWQQLDFDVLRKRKSSSANVCDQHVRHWVEILMVSLMSKLLLIVGHFHLFYYFYNI